MFKSLSKINDETKVDSTITSGGGVVGRGNKSMINSKKTKHVGKKTKKQLNN